MTDILGMLRSSLSAFAIPLCVFAALASACGGGPAVAEAPPPTAGYRNKFDRHYDRCCYSARSPARG